MTLDWSTLIQWTHLKQPEITITGVDIVDWQMLAERWENESNFPKFTSDEPSNGPKRFTTTLKYLRASPGQFTYEDHEAPWSIVARNIDLDMGNLPNYHGTAAFTGGTVAIQNNVPFYANMKASYVIDGGLVHLNRIEFDTDGAKTIATGDVDFAHWPEQTYEFKSRVQFARMRQLFFKDEKWESVRRGRFHRHLPSVQGRARSVGHLCERAVRDQSIPVRFVVRRPAVDPRSPQRPRCRREDLRRRQPVRLHDPAAREAGASHDAVRREFHGRRSRDAHRFRADERPSLCGHGQWRRRRARMARGKVLGGSRWRASGRRASSGRAADDGALRPLDRRRAPADAGHAFHEWGPFAPAPLPQHLPIAGDLSFRFDPEQVSIDAGRFATERTHVTFQGATAWGIGRALAFHVTSDDWQESDQLLAGIMTDFGAPRSPVTFGGRGEFDGTMTGPFRAPRVEGEFSGEDLRGFDTLWGGGGAHIVVENNYVRVTDGVVTLKDSEMHFDGLFSLGFPRDDGGDEIDARIRVVRRDMDSLRHAFGIDEYPVSGSLSGEFHLTGGYLRPVGFGGMTLDHFVAYGEPFQTATASLRFDGTGVRLDGINVEKDGGSIGGAAFVGWDATYSFNLDGRRIPVEKIGRLHFRRRR